MEKHSKLLRSIRDLHHLQNKTKWNDQLVEVAIKEKALLPVFIAALSLLLLCLCAFKQDATP